MNIINIYIVKNTGLACAAIIHVKLLIFPFVIHLFVRSNNFNNNNIKSQIIRFRVLRSGDPLLYNRKWQ